MSNFSPKLEDDTDEHLRYMINELDFRVVPLSSDELTRRSIQKLLDKISDLDKTMTRASKTTDKFSKVLIALTVVLIILGIFQFVISVQTSSLNRWLGAGIVILVIGIITWFLIKFDKMID